MIDLTKTPEEIKEELINLYFNKINFPDGEECIEAEKCAIIAIKFALSICPKEKYGDHAMCGWIPYHNPDYSKLVQVRELLEKI